MDNASKALIMAGAILLAVAIVGLGMFLFGQARGVVDLSIGQIDALGVTGVNNKLLQYEGRNVRGSEIKELIQWIEAVNIRDAMPEDITGFPDASTIINTRTYTVTCDTDDATGYVNEVTITAI
jgi:hypothetical protein